MKSSFVRSCYLLQADANGAANLWTSTSSISLSLFSEKSSSKFTKKTLWQDLRFLSTLKCLSGSSTLLRVRTDRDCSLVIWVKNCQPRNLESLLRPSMPRLRNSVRSQEKNHLSVCSEVQVKSTCPQTSWSASSSHSLTTSPWKWVNWLTKPRQREDLSSLYSWLVALVRVPSSRQK